jgi:hypothetical protein
MADLKSPVLYASLPFSRAFSAALLVDFMLHLGIK